MSWSTSAVVRGSRPATRPVSARASPVSIRRRSCCVSPGCSRDVPTRCAIVEGAAEALPVADDSVSVVWSIACVHHWADIDAGLREVRRILRSGGRWVAIERRSQPDARGLASHGWTERASRGVRGSLPRTRLDRSSGGARHQRSPIDPQRGRHGTVSRRRTHKSLIRSRNAASGAAYLLLMRKCGGGGGGGGLRR